MESLRSKPDDWAKGDAEIIVAAVVEIDFVSEFESQANRPERRLEAARRVDGGVQTRIAQAQNCAYQARDRKQAGAKAKIHETCFEGDKRSKAAARRLQLWPEQSVRNSDRRALDGGEISVEDVDIRFFEVDAVVVRQFAFHHHVVMDAIAKARAQSKVVSAGLRDVQVIDEDSGFDAFLRREREGGKQRQDEQETVRCPHAKSFPAYDERQIAGVVSSSRNGLLTRGNAAEGAQ